MQIWGITDRGLVREQNQDAFAVKQLDNGAGLAIVCDGMGGAKAGNIASSMAVELFLSVFLGQNEEENDTAAKRMVDAADKANREIFRRSGAEAECHGMGTTMVAAYMTQEKALILNEGDSRAYHIGAAGINRVTRDHSLVQHLLERGDITPEEARCHPQKNLITRALGVEAELRSDQFEQMWVPGEFLLLCSDGLSNTVTEQEMLYEILHGGSPETCCQRLLDIALKRGAPDNVTAVLAMNE